MASWPCCQVCGRQQQVIKRCTRCQNTFYCSRDCQVTDWKNHKTICAATQANSSPTQHLASGGINDVIPSQTTIPSTALLESDKKHTIQTDKSIWDGEQKSAKKGDAPSKLLTLQSSSGKNEDSSSKKQTGIRSGGNIKCSFTPKGEFSGTDSANLFDDRFRHDVQSKRPLVVRKGAQTQDRCDSESPIYNPEHPSIYINVKANKEKHAVHLNTRWNGEEVFGYISKVIQVPLDKLKLITKGKVVTADSFWTVAKQKSLFQAIGEKSESEEGISSEDVEVVMNQMSVERNTAIKALKQCSGDVIDAMMLLGNK